MKKKLFVLVCFLVALTTGSIMANNCLNDESVPNITYTINLGDISELSEIELSNLLDDTFSNINMEMLTEELQCKITVKLSVSGFKVSIEVPGDCSEVVEKAKQIVKEMSSL